MPSEILSQVLPLGTSRNPFNYEKVEEIGRDISTQWLTLDEIAQQINLYEDESQDGYLQSLDLVVRQAIEDYLGMSIYPITYKVYYGASGMVASPVSLDLPEVSQNFNQNQPGITIQSVGFWNDSNVFTLFDKADYYYDNSGNKIILGSVPSNISTYRTAPIEVKYQTAANPLANYPVIKQAGLLLFTHLYNNRSNTVESSMGLKNIPFGFDTLLRKYKDLVM